MARRPACGTTMIDRMARFALKGGSGITFAPEGVRCVIAFPVSHKRAAAQG